MARTKYSRWSRGEKADYNCFFCNSAFQFSEHIYAGKWLPHYKIMVCEICYEANWDGLARREWQTKLLDHLKNEGIEPPHPNKKGWLPLG